MYDISDHFPIFMFYGKEIRTKNKHITFKSRSLNERAMEIISNNLANIDWTTLHNMEIDDAHAYFIKTLADITDQHAPMKDVTIHSKNIILTPWMTPALLQSSKTLDKLYKKQLTQTSDHPSHVKYTNYRNLYNKLKRNSKNHYYSKLFNDYKGDVRKTWHILNSITGRSNDKSTLNNKFRINTKITDDTSEIANGFCKYFSEIGEVLASKIPKGKTSFDTYLTKQNSKSIFFSPTDAYEIHKIIESLKSKKSTGHDNISAKFIKQVQSNITLPLSILINKSLEQGYVPKMFKTAKVTPIYKAKDAQEFTNYRPISLLPTVSKILEKVVHKRLYNFLNMQGLLNPSQYGFMPKHSTIQAIAEFTSHISQSNEKHENSLSVFLDLSKAFDTIDHNILLRKLNHYGVRGVALDWFRSYLSERNQFVKFKSTESELLKVSCGVPQGSVLGPLLFIIYTNDLPNSLNSSTCILFADDTTIIYSSHNLDILFKNVSHDLSSLSEWFKANKLSLNVSKTNYILIKNSNNTLLNHSLKIGDEKIQQVNTAKFLGIMIDDKLNWNVHIKHCKNKLSSGLYALNSSKHILSHEHLKSLYYTLIHSHLTYGLLLWGSTYKTFLHKLEVLQNKAIRSITNSKYNESTEPVYKQLGILPLPKLYQLEAAKFMFLNYKRDLPLPLLSIFTPNIDIHQHGTRHRNDPHISVRRTHLLSQCFIHNAPNIWYNIPPPIKDTKTVGSFCSKMKKYLNA